MIVRILALAAALAAASGAWAEGPSYQPRDFARDVQAAVRRNDPHWIATHSHYPLNVYATDYKPEKRHGVLVVSGRGAFLARYRDIFGSRLKAKILSQRLDDLFTNAQGVMIGDEPSVWFDDFGRTAGEHLYRIKAINR